MLESKLWSYYIAEDYDRKQTAMILLVSAFYHNMQRNEHDKASHEAQYFHSLLLWPSDREAKHERTNNRYSKNFEEEEKDVRGITYLFCDSIPVKTLQKLHPKTSPSGKYFKLPTKVKSTGSC